ncbi:Ig-like domain-containing protein [Kurthia massiliensis]|uniref:Ig-like domain-containing protein n=1 Tax=Kurthia massiliensis TaxID=1033739 RepID=UPI00028900D0|nr:Ig-like domain-containing protein [Kurthia massiliensis]
MRVIAGITLAAALLTPFSVADAKELGHSVLTDVEIAEENVQVDEVANIVYTIKLNKASAAGDTVRITLPTGATLQAQSDTDVKNTEGRVAAKANYTPGKQQVLVTLNDVAEKATYSDLTVNVPVKLNETTLGEHQIALPVKDGTKQVAYTLTAAPAEPTIDATGSLNTSMISWETTIDAHAGKLSQAQLNSAFGDGHELDGDVTVTYEQPDGTSETKTYKSRLLPDRTLKLNLGTIENQIVKITYDTTVTDLRDTYENDYTVTSLEQSNLTTTAKVDGKDAVVPLEEEDEATVEQLPNESNVGGSNDLSFDDSTGQNESNDFNDDSFNSSSTNSPIVNSARGQDDVIVQDATSTATNNNSTTENTLQQLPQTGTSNPLWIGVACLGAAYMLLRRK